MSIFNDMACVCGQRIVMALSMTLEVDKILLDIQRVLFLLE